MFSNKYKTHYKFSYFSLYESNVTVLSAKIHGWKKLVQHIRNKVGCFRQRFVMLLLNQVAYTLVQKKGCKRASDTPTKLQLTVLFSQKEHELLPRLKNDICKKYTSIMIKKWLNIITCSLLNVVGIQSSFCKLRPFLATWLVNFLPLK